MERIVSSAMVGNPAARRFLHHYDVDDDDDEYADDPSPSIAWNKKVYCVRGSFELRRGSLCVILCFLKFKPMDGTATDAGTERGNGEWLFHKGVRVAGAVHDRKLIKCGQEQRTDVLRALMVSHILVLYYHIAHFPRARNIHPYVSGFRNFYLGWRQLYGFCVAH